MRTPDHRCLDHRVTRLERENRWLKFFVAATILLTGAPWLVSHVTADERIIEATRFLLYDEWGKRRGGLEVLDDGTAVLNLRDRFERNRAVLTVDVDGKTQLGFIDAGGTLRVGLASLTGGAPLFTLKDPSGRNEFKAP